MALPQPYQCLICQVRFTRHENLKRHAALHSRSKEEASLPCEFCQVTFSRPDLRQRHMKKKHPEHEQRRDRERLRYGPSGSRLRMDRRRPRTERMYSESPDYQDGLNCQDLNGGNGMEMESENWETRLGYIQDHLNHGHHTDDPNSATNSPTGAGEDEPQLLTGPVTKHSSTNSIMQDPEDLEWGLQQEISFQRFPHQLDIQLPSMAVLQSTSFEKNTGGFNVNQHIPDESLVNSLSSLQTDWFPSTLQTTQGCNLFFSHVSHFIPFLHQPTFDANETAPHLVLAILSLAYQYGDDPEGSGHTDSGSSLSVRCFHRARALIASEEARAEGVIHNISMVQTYLLLQICAMMYLCGGDYSAHGLKMHSTMTSLARAGGMMQPLPLESAATKDLDSLWREFVKAESHKRTLFAVHQIDALWYQFLSIPRSISHLEIKHELPCPEAHWEASSSAEWAHRQLLSRHSGPPMQYADAVRCFLSPDSDLNSLPAFDPYGAINIAQFLISSAREVSGWSTMTGMVSMERLGALTTSLVALKPFIYQQVDISNAAHAVTSTATWETAMIELQMWSPAHTGGIVEASIDAMLHQWTYLAPSYEFLCAANLAKAIQPHVEWFLQYLDTTQTPNFEAPWITLYAYRATLIAWQLVKGGVPGAMRVVGVPDGDVDRALMWARKAFRRRSRLQVGGLINSYLDNLGN